MDLFFNFADFPTWLLFAFLGLGFFMLWLGGNWLTDGSAGLAIRLNISPTVVGLTVVSVATSMPELITSLISAGRGSPGIAVGNIIGSNIANVGLIMGVAALVWPFTVQRRLVVKEVPFLIVATILFGVFSFSGGLARWEGIILLLIIAGYVWWLMNRKQAAQDAQAEVEEVLQEAPKSLTWCLLFVLLGGVALACGADALVNSSVELAERWGVSDTLIGVTMVALGTSLPELAATVAAAMKKHTDLVAGNIIGSNIFNLLLIGGLVSTIYPLDVDPSLVKFEYPAMTILTLGLWFIFARDLKVSRAEGGILLFFYTIIIGTAAWMGMM